MLLLNLKVYYIVTYVAIANIIYYVAILMIHTNLVLEINSSVFY